MTKLLTGAALILAAIALPVSAHAQYEEPDTGRVLMLGAGAYAVTNPYESAKDDVELGALPLFLFQQGRVKIDLSGLSWRAFQAGPVQLEARISPRIPLVDPDDTELFDGLDRDVGVDAGLRLTAHRGAFSANAEYLIDISDQSGGQSVDLNMAWSTAPTERLELEVSAGVVWSDEDLSTWLYGLTTEEAVMARAYEFGVTPGAPSGGVWTPHFGVQARYRVSERVLLIGGVEADLYNSDITDSPLMADDSSTGVFIGIMRRF
ncbi:MipA/OmpV family protein [Oceanicaulis sp. LC35]|uniref:MipA/OmpV family protein n=1 Tax=Oceanicaulis sp. LC35 TaxID=3349635 RepID=UPI003F863D43